MKKTLMVLAISFALSAHTSAITTEFFTHSSFLSNTSGLTVVDFESASRGTISANDFLSQGIASISNRDGFDVEVGVAVGSVSLASGDNGLSSSFYNSSGASAYNNSVTDNIDFVLVNTANAAGIFMGNVGPGETAVQFLDQNNVVIAEETITESHTGIINNGNFNNRIFYGIVTDQRIATIRTIEGSGDSDGIVYDDVQFNVSTVPEPSSFVLGSLCFLFCCFRFSKKN